MTLILYAILSFHAPMDRSHIEIEPIEPEVRYALPVDRSFTWHATEKI